MSVFRIFVQQLTSNVESRLSCTGEIVDVNTHTEIVEALSAVEVSSLLRASKFYGQATKGARWMPWQKQAMKDAASCDKLRGAAHTR